MPAAAITYHNDDHESIQQPTQCIALQLTGLCEAVLATHEVRLHS